MIGAHTEQVRALLADHIDAGVFGSLEVHAAATITSACAPAIGSFDVLSVASAVWATQQGHVCFDMDDVTPWSGLAPARRPDPNAWSNHLVTSQLVQHVANWDVVPDGTRPLVVRGRRIYLARQWIDEMVVANRLLQRQALAVGNVDPAVVDALFPAEARAGRQYEAVLRSMETRTSIVTGGPGTGKTYTVARILVAAVRSGIRSIALAAPTAKAAVQMRESLSKALAEDLADLDGDHRRILERLEPTTIHRLLRSRPGSATRFHHGAGRLLPFELVVVDEMSMVSLPMMARLLEAFDDSTSLVLVGDPGQLDSVENGSVLRDLTDLDLGPSMPMIVLETSRRNQGTRSSAFADAVRVGDEKGVRNLLEDPDTDGTLRWIESADPLGSMSALGDLIDLWREMTRLAQAGDVDRVLEMVNDARVLCPHRAGPHGVEAWNIEISEAIADSRDRWRPGDIVVKTRNDLGQGLSNGDTGVVVRIAGELVFAFAHGGGLVTVPVSVDDAVQLAFATTVHKAQGSEYGHVVVVVPPAGSPLGTRELLYTAMTRAKPRATLIGTSVDIVHAAVTQQRRWSGLADRLGFG